MERNHTLIALSNSLVQVSLSDPGLSTSRDWLSVMWFLPNAEAFGSGRGHLVRVPEAK